MAVKRNSKTVKFRYLSSRGLQRDVVHILNFGDLTPHLTYAFEQWKNEETRVETILQYVCHIFYAYGNVQYLS
jgi:hypothetical protein